MNTIIEKTHRSEDGEIMQTVPVMTHLPEVKSDLSEKLSKNFRRRARLAEQRQLVQKHGVVARVNWHLFRHGPVRTMEDL